MASAFIVKGDYKEMEDRTSAEYHLTPRGWITGTNRYFDKVQGTEVERTSDTVETIIVTSEQTSPWSKQYSYSESVWKSLDISEKDLAALYEKFPKQFPSREGPQS